MKAGRGIYDCGHVLFATTWSVRSNNWYKTHGKTKLESEIVTINEQHMKEVKLLACFLGRRWFSLAFSRCGVQDKLKFLLCFCFIVSLLPLHVISIVAGLYRPPNLLQARINCNWKRILITFVTGLRCRDMCLCYLGDLNLDRLRPDKPEGKLLIDVEETHGLECVIRAN